MSKSIPFCDCDELVACDSKAALVSVEVTTPITVFSNESVTPTDAKDVRCRGLPEPAARSVMDRYAARAERIVNHLTSSVSVEGKIDSAQCNGKAIGSRADFVEIYPILAAELTKELPALFELPPQQAAWVQKLIDINVQGGKMNRGLSVIHTLQLLVENRQLTRNEIFNAYVLGWCVEWLQAFFLVADDIMDQSITRRGVPCWYRQDNPMWQGGHKVGLVAINDSFILEGMIYRILSKYFRNEKYYAQLLDLFHEVSYQTELGQLLDLTTTPPGGKVDLSIYTLENYKRIVKYKTAYYSFYLPVALAMMMTGISSPPALETAKDILLPMGEYFQVQDDFLDCYGAPEVIGKIGRDIEENKCSWLIIQALAHASPSQKALLEKHYGRDNASDVAVVKKIYNEVNIKAIFEKYEQESYAQLTQKIKTVRILPQAVFTEFVSKIYKRQL